MTDRSERVLVVEDEPAIRRVLTELLRRDLFEVRSLGEAAEVEVVLATFHPEIVILDLGLPDANGFDVLRSIRARSTVPVIVLSGRDAESDRVLALELGADDYVVKPFLNGELVARVRAHLRRSGGPEPARTVLADHDLEVDVASRQAWLSGRSVPLTAREFDVLVQLLRSPGQVFSRPQLIDAAWRSAVDGVADQVVVDVVHGLRRKVGADRIGTVRGVGYRYEPAGADRRLAE